MQERNKSVIFINASFFFGIISLPAQLDLEKLRGLLQEDEDAETVGKKFVVKKGIQFGKGKDKVKKEEACQINYVGSFKEKKVTEFLRNYKFLQLK